MFPYSLITKLKILIEIHPIFIRLYVIQKKHVFLRLNWNWNPMEEKAMVGERSRTIDKAMKVYHGSYIKIDKIDLSKSKPNKQGWRIKKPEKTWLIKDFMLTLRL